MDIFGREINLIGQDNFEKLSSSSVAVFGLGGVGSYAAESLVRAGIGRLLICDDDVITPDNINRQLLALSSTIGKYKTDVAEERLKDINPFVEIENMRVRFGNDTADLFDFGSYDAIADCIDSVQSKVLLAVMAKEQGIDNIVSCMGTGNKLSTEFIAGDIFDTSVCPLAKVMRRELRKNGVEKLRVIYSKEEPRAVCNETDGNNRRIHASISYVPAAAGLFVAMEIIRGIMGPSEED